MLKAIEPSVSVSTRFWSRVLLANHCALKVDPVLVDGTAKRILLLRPWMRIDIVAVPDGNGVAPGIAAADRVASGKLPVPPWPVALAFSTTVRVISSITR